MSLENNITALSGHIEALSKLLGPGGVLADAGDRARYQTDWMDKFHGRAWAVLRPGDLDALSRALAYCNRHRLAVVPQAGNTGLVGGSVPGEDGAFVLSVERMNRILEVDADAATMTVEAGAVLEQVQEAALEAGLQFPLDLGSKGSCRIGGNLATNAGGLKVLRYGHIRALTLGLRVVLADGTVLDGLSKLRKNNTGFDLKQLFIGSEGTLGVIQAATLRLVPLEGGREVAVLALEDVAAAPKVLAAARHAFPAGLNSVELMRRDAVALVTSKIDGARDPFDAPHAAYMLLEVAAGDGEHARARMLALFEDLFEAGHVVDGVIAESDAQAEALWLLREAVPEAVARTAPVHKYDLTFAVGDIAGFIEACDRALAEVAPGVRPVYFGHFGDGNIHVNVMMGEGGDRDEFAALQDVVDAAVFDLVGKMKGSISAEHGIGVAKRAYLDRNRSAAEIAAMRRIKALFDPNGIMNPGKLLPDEDLSATTGR